MAFLLQSGLAWRQRLSCEAIGRLGLYDGEFVYSRSLHIAGILSFCLRTHHDNRDGLGVSATHVQELVTGILKLGYVEAESKRICVEVPGDSRGDVTRKPCRVARGSRSLRAVSVVQTAARNGFRRTPPTFCAILASQLSFKNCATMAWSASFEKPGSESLQGLQHEHAGAIPGSKPVHYMIM